MKVVFARAALDELDHIRAWIAADNPYAANALIARIEAKAMLLSSPSLARMGRAGSVEGTRELLESPYILVYKIDEANEEIIIASVVHGARDRLGRGAGPNDR